MHYAQAQESRQSTLTRCDAMVRIGFVLLARNMAPCFCLFEIDTTTLSSFLISNVSPSSATIRYRRRHSGKTTDHTTSPLVNLMALSTPSSYVYSFLHPQFHHGPTIPRPEIDPRHEEIRILVHLITTTLSSLSKPFSTQRSLVEPRSFQSLIHQDHPRQNKLSLQLALVGSQLYFI